MASPSIITSSSATIAESTSNAQQQQHSRKIRSRYSAYCRRISENDEFDRLSSVLPIDRAISSQMLDKASIVRLASTCIRLHSFGIMLDASNQHQYDNQYQHYESQFDSNRSSIAIIDSSHRIGACILEV